ncbi:response regulator with CheY-like receiver, AAA-type ATPase, and DNA-binding domains [Thermanaerovibrio velox DSM 12556]|uniref:Response regulator with CheY-like receiver, AAA-type ATPase, and DNA-binding domains n=1 Tax=Thermanaerovibrio velox DSM 12556 TaxID=926567 RepID=H0UR08_9BACT|nr:response regulator [Thermanaerovibrio velox]EHM10845.1 response regulator with CheY-like receiver, AAA-type ATPase, and DNA-binding domains [Thermanaerovibrio velox DSM 12556]
MLRIGALDDDEAILFTLTAMAKTQGWDLETTTSVDRFLFWVRDGAKDIYLLDYHLPRMSGLNVLRQAKSIAPDSVIAMLTVEQNPEAARRLLEEGAEDFITKPIRLADFCSRINLLKRLSASVKGVWRESRKGLSEEKIRRAKGILEESGDRGVTAEEMAGRMGVAYATAHRYLEYLVTRGLVEREEAEGDGRPGRPRLVYRLYRAGGRQSGLNI